MEVRATRNALQVWSRRSGCRFLCVACGGQDIQVESICTSVMNVQLACHVQSLLPLCLPCAAVSGRVLFHFLSMVIALQIHM
jgi:hypothetical protein